MSPSCTLFVEHLEALSEVDSDWNLQSKLYNLCQLIENDPDSSSVIPAIFAFLEAHPNADFGAPGPLTHFLETRPDYEKCLAESVTKKPVEHTVQMVHRILNSDLPTEKRAFLTDLLHSVLVNPQADEVAREQANHYLEIQAKRRRT